MSVLCYLSHFLKTFILIIRSQFLNEFQDSTVASIQFAFATVSLHFFNSLSANSWGWNLYNHVGKCLFSLAESEGILRSHAKALSVGSP